jgi:hypothetical protein
MAKGKAAEFVPERDQRTVRDFQARQGQPPHHGAGGAGRRQHGRHLPERDLRSFS